MEEVIYMDFEISGSSKCFTIVSYKIEKEKAMIHTLWRITRQFEI